MAASWSFWLFVTIARGMKLTVEKKKTFVVAYL